jgi:LacI family transcriptional regulator
MDERMSGKKRVTQEAIANLLNISVSQVSRALNGKGEVSPETRKKICDIADQLGYSPNLIAQSLRYSRTNTFGVIQPDIANPFFANLVRGIENYSQAIGFSIFVSNTYEDTEKEYELVKHMVDRGVDGILLVPVRERDIKKSTFQEFDIPAVLIARCVKECGVDCIVVDDKKGGYLATEHLIKKGRERIIYLSGPEDMVASLDRLEGYHRALSDYGIRFSKDMLHVAGTTLEHGYNAMQIVLDSKIDVDAVFAFNDVIAYGCLRVFHERGIRVPDDIAIIGYDDANMNMVVNPTLTSVRQPTGEMGSRAAELLIDILNADRSSREPEVILFDPELKAREST